MPIGAVFGLTGSGIKDLRQAYLKLIKVVLCEDAALYDFAQQVEATRWVASTHQLIAAAEQIALRLSHGYPVLVHCRNGWDHTCQLTSLVMLMVDAFYRTVGGFLTLIENEWVACGHRFALRTGVGERWDVDPTPLVAERYPTARRVLFGRMSDVGDKAASPVFLQFLDAVHQIVAQHPTRFEFSDALLVFLADSAFNGRFGTFFESHETRDLILFTRSLSAHVMDHFGAFVNPDYKEDVSLMRPDLDASQIGLWDAFFLRQHPLARPEPAHQPHD